MRQEDALNARNSGEVSTHTRKGGLALNAEAFLKTNGYETHQSTKGGKRMNCTRCGEEITFQFLADDGTRMYSEADGYLVCQDFTELDEYGECRPSHTIRCMSWRTPCYYTKGVESCFHDGCAKAHKEGEDFEVWMAREGEPCVACGVATFERCDNEDCDEVVHDSCGGYCKDHHCYDSQCEVCPEWPVQIAKETA